MCSVKQTPVQPRAIEHQPLNRGEWPQAHFTLSDARRALPYVARIIEDAAEAFEAIHLARAELKVPSSTMSRPELCARRDGALRRLNRAIDECNAVGADLIDLRQGLVRFNADLSGRPVSLVWRLGDPVLNAWSGPEV